MPLPAYGETIFVNSRINKDSNATHHQVVNVCAVVAKGIIYCMQSYWRLQKQAAAGRKLPLIFSSGGGANVLLFLDSSPAAGPPFFCYVAAVLQWVPT